MYATVEHARPRVLYRRCRAPSSAVQRARLQHLRPRRIQSVPGSSRYVLQAAKADPSLLGTYDEERSPIAAQIVEPRQQVDRRVRAHFRKRSACLRPRIREQMKAQHGGSRKAATLRAPPTQREKLLRAAIAHKNYEFNCHGVEMNQRYDSSKRPSWRTARSEPAFRARPGTLLSGNDLAGRPAAACLVGAIPGRTQGLNASTWCGHGRFTAADGHRRRGLDRGRAADHGGLDRPATI